MSRPFLSILGRLLSVVPLLSGCTQALELKLRAQHEAQTVPSSSAKGKKRKLAPLLRSETTAPRNENPRTRTTDSDSVKTRNQFGRLPDDILASILALAVGRKDARIQSSSPGKGLPLTGSRPRGLLT